MGKPAKGKKMIGITASEDLLTIIDARADALGWPRAKFALAILEQWHEAGAKPVNKIDATMAPEVMAQLASKALKKRAS